MLRFSNSEVMEETGEFPVRKNKVFIALDEEFNEDFVGHPLQASSPITPPGYNGDGSHILSKDYSSRGPEQEHDHSPLRSDLRFQEMNLSNTELKDAPMLCELDSSTRTPPRSSNSMEEMMLAEKISMMEENEVKSLLHAALVDNLGLRKELEYKEKRVTEYKGQMLALMEWKLKEICDSGNNENDDAFDNAQRKRINVRIAELLHSDSEEEPLQRFKERDVDDDDDMLPIKAVRTSEQITMVEDVRGIRRSLSFIREFAQSIDLDQDLIRHRLRGGYRITNQLLIGGFAGWTSALFIKKFGKLALSATLGGVALLVYTSRKGYVNVNYESIYAEIARMCNDDIESSQLNSSNPSFHQMQSETDQSRSHGESYHSRSGTRRDVTTSSTATTSTYSKLTQAKKWITSHTYTVGGFVLTFAYNFLG